MARLAIAEAQTLFHPMRGGDNGSGSRQSSADRAPIPAQPARLSRLVSVNRKPPTHQVTVRHHHARNVAGEAAVAVLAEVENVRPDVANQRPQVIAGIFQVFFAFLTP